MKKYTNVRPNLFAVDILLVESMSREYDNLESLHKKNSNSFFSILDLDNSKNCKFGRDKVNKYRCAVVDQERDLPNKALLNNIISKVDSGQKANKFELTLYDLNVQNELRYIHKDDAAKENCGATFGLDNESLINDNCTPHMSYENIKNNFTNLLRSKNIRSGQYYTAEEFFSQQALGSTSLIIYDGYIYRGKKYNRQKANTILSVECDNREKIHEKEYERITSTLSYWFRFFDSLKKQFPEQKFFIIGGGPERIKMNQKELKDIKNIYKEKIQKDLEETTHDQINKREDLELILKYFNSILMVDNKNFNLFNNGRFVKRPDNYKLLDYDKTIFPVNLHERYCCSDYTYIEFGKGDDLLGTRKKEGEWFAKDRRSFKNVAQNIRTLFSPFWNEKGVSLQDTDYTYMKRNSDALNKLINTIADI